MLRKKLYIIRGLPGSGKSTLAKKMVASGMADVHFETDMFFEQDGVYKFDGRRLKEAHKWCQDKVEQAIKEGKNVVVSNTFTQKWEMSKYFDIAKFYGAKPDVIVARGEYQNVHNVPETALRIMKERWEE